ncbi:adenosylcobinamide kinase /adenosylcobinamide-phosphate guanylyltransferase [Ureibacillus xyleni]|uniref:Adenosylcobinamide kinase /adenosylcobinamide-phosphate guanylyltransferase n=1 Tax=Ureibacillus xyleni TaxID=614648 RepID=A0A285TJU9_9BACL|nr:bifunctional adenosylcobinamide kinase/adenosylcobinamide-phosphate guanylyltransferase [Ureibacillus xyleni]SOC20976.1 adenosylcobinamide kinase /adenosylcobinamide-phosphate guanylyltransferase [Ureibacillus xyleni]
MRVIIGGAYNGKREYVKKSLLHVNQKYIHFFEGELPLSNFSKKDYVILSNFEKMIMKKLEVDEDKIANELAETIKRLDTQTNVICICNDLGRGIVPMDKEQRKLRDTCGRLYQKLFEESSLVVRIWYGIPQILKGDVDNDQF